MNIRYQILSLKDKNRALADRCRLLKQWISVYESHHVLHPGKDHRQISVMHWNHVEELKDLIHQIESNGSKIQCLKS